MEMDTIKLYIDHHVLYNRNTLDNITEPVITIINGTEYRRYHIDNFTWDEHEYGTTIIGSISKYYQDHNYRPLTLAQNSEAIQHLSERVGYNLLNVRVTRIDFGDTIICNQLPSRYKQLLIECPYYQKIDYQFGGVEFRHKSGKFLFYDKHLEHAECQRKTSRVLPIPEEYIGNNAARFEYSLTRNLQDRLGYVYMHEFLTEQAYRQLIDRWEISFNLIRVLYLPTVHSQLLQQMRWEKWLLLIAVVHYGEQGFHTLLNNLIADGFLKSYKVSRIKREIRGLSELVLNQIPVETLIEELRRLITERAEWNRDNLL